jgi:hypothetical protein
MKRSAAQSVTATGKRTPSRVSGALDKSLLSYAAAAGAAGVGMLAVAPPAHAKIVYTPANVTLLPNQVAGLDLNHDGIRDFFFFFSFYYGGALSIDPVLPRNRIAGNKSYASALPAGVSVGPGGKFKQDHGLMVATNTVYLNNYTSKGPWTGNKTRYLGLKFFINGKAHYGWARLEVTEAAQGAPRLSATLTGYAYETVANKPIKTGKEKGPGAASVQPATLGHLASGSSAISSWRVKRSADRSLD